MPLISRDEIYNIIYSMLTDKQRIFIDSYFKMDRVRKDVAIALKMTKRNIEKYLTHNIVKLIIKYKDMMESEIKFNRKIDPEWLQSEVRDLYDEAKRKYGELIVKLDKKDTDEKILNKLEENMQTYLKQLTDLEYKFGEQFKDDVVNLSILKPEEQLELLVDLELSLRKYLRSHKWGVKGTEEKVKIMCKEKPELIKDAIGMYHCPGCGEMVVAGFPHPDYDNIDYSKITKINKHNKVEF